MDAGKLKVLAQASETRFPLLPNIPTTAEVGMPKIVVVSWFGVLGPAKMPKAAVTRVARELEAVLAQPALKQRFIDVGAEIATMTPANFAKLIAVEKKKWKALATAAKIPLQEF